MDESQGAPASVFDPVSTATTFEGVVERIGNAVRLGLLPAGTRLPPERELAAMLHVSRWTLRKAITTLVQSGHLQSLRGRSGGTFVLHDAARATADTRLPANWRAILDVRMATEVGIAALAAQRATADDLLALEALVDEMTAAASFEDYRRADARFHIALAEATKSTRLVTSATDVQAEASQVVALVPHPPAVLEHANREHRLLVEALRRHDVESAVSMVRRHLEGTERIVAGLRSG
jgi:GntR family transcriptional regulator, transcriptional repressor for pyruvate dehydrogenase complex